MKKDCKPGGSPLTAVLFALPSSAVILRNEVTKDLLLEAFCEFAKKILRSAQNDSAILIPACPASSSKDLDACFFHVAMVLPVGSSQPSPCTSLRTSAYTGVAIRLSAHPASARHRANARMRPQYVILSERSESKDLKPYDLHHVRR